MILHLITDFSGKGGAQTMLARLLAASSSPRIVLVSLTEVSDYYRRIVDNPRVEYRTLMVNNRLRLPFALVELSRIIRREQPEAIVSWMYHAMIAGTAAAMLARTGTPVFWNIRQSLDDRTSLSRSTRIALELGRLMSRVPKGIIYSSTRALAMHQSYGYRNSNSVVIANGFDIPSDVGFGARSPRVFGVAGRFHPQKDYWSFLRAAAIASRKRQGLRFVAAGKGVSKDNSEFVQMIAEAGLPPGVIELRGEIDDMDGFYREIDVLVLSSRTEGFPNVVAEAMSYGKPAITTDVGDSAVVVGDTGYVVAPRDADGLADAICAMFDLLPEDYASKARAAHDRVRREYALPAVTEKFDLMLRS